MEAQKVFWLGGRHAVNPSWGAPLGKVHSAGMQLLKSLGWQEVRHSNTVASRCHDCAFSHTCPPSPLLVCLI